MRLHRRRTLLSGVLAVAMLLALPTPYVASAQYPVAPDAAAAAVGQVIYQRYCASCHGIGGLGDGPLAKDLKVPPTDLTKLSKANKGIFPYDRVVKVIDGRKTTRGHGTPDMPVWGEIFPKTQGTASGDVETAVARITNYIWSIQKK